MADAGIKELDPEVKARALTQTDAEIDASGLSDADKKIAKELRALWEKQGDKAVLEFAAMPPNPNLTKPALEAFAENAIGTNLDATTGKKDYLTPGATLNPEQQRAKDRHEKLSKAATVVREIIEKGYDKANPLHQTEVRSKLREAVGVYPPTELIFSALPAGTARVDFLDRFAEKKLFRIKIKEGADALLKPESVPNADQVNQAEQKVTTAQKEKDTTDLEVGALNGRIGQLERLLGLATAGDPVDPDAEQKLTDDKEDEIKTLQEEVAQLRENIKATRAKKNVTTADENLITGTGGWQEQINTKLGEIKSARTDKTRHATRKKYMDELVQKRQEKEKKDKEKAEKDKALTLAQNQLGQAKLAREQAENTLVAQAEDIFRNAALAVIREKNDAADREHDEALKKKIAETTDAEQKYILKQVQTRWNEVSRKTPSVHGIESRLRKNVIKQDYDDLLIHGPEAVIKKMLDDELVEDPTSTATPKAKAKRSELIRRGVAGVLSSEDVIKGNPDLVKKMQGDVAQQLIRRAMQTKDFNHKHVEVIALTNWGDDLVNKAMDENQKIKDAVKEYRDRQGLLGDPMHWAAHHKMRIFQITLGVMGAAWLAPFAIMALKAYGGSMASNWGRVH